MSTFFTSDSTFGISMWTILLSVLECSTVTLFLIGCINYVRIVKKRGNKLSEDLAVLATCLSFIGGFPNALDKVSRMLFSYDLWFNSTWMFFFVGISYMALFISAIFIDKEQKSNSTALLSAAPAFHKPMKYATMTMAAVGMTGFYITMYKKAKHVIGNYALLYFATFITTALLVVFSAVGTFTTVWPNILAQIVNNAGYAAFIAANRIFLEMITD